MKTHDCSKCPGAGQCPLEEIAPWLNEHSEETEVAVREVVTSLSQFCTLVIKGIPIPMYDLEAIAYAIKGAFSLGYHKGRTYQDVPAVFKDV